MKVSDYGEVLFVDTDAEERDRVRDALGDAAAPCGKDIVILTEEYLRRGVFVDEVDQVLAKYPEADLVFLRSENA